MQTIRLTPALALRPLMREDVSDIFTALDTQRDYLGRWLPFVAHTRCEDDTRGFVESVLSADPFEPVFTVRVGPHFAGLAGFKSTDHLTRSTEIGYWMREEFQGRGIMTAAVKRLCRMAFLERGMESIVIRCAVGNLPSNRIPRRIGFELCRIEAHGEQLAGGEWTDLNVYVLYKSAAINLL